MHNSQIWLSAELVQMVSTLHLLNSCTIVGTSCNHPGLLCTLKHRRSGKNMRNPVTS
jgi:hypothetical protein